LIHSLDNLKAFAKLNLEIPLTSSQVSATLELIQARKTYYLDQRAKVNIFHSLLCCVSLCRTGINIVAGLPK
jgi:hypothetical protein